MRYIITLLLVFLVVFLSSCSEGKYEGMSKTELMEKKRHCDSIKKKSPVFATGCENVSKELERRAAK